MLYLCPGLNVRITSYMYLAWLFDIFILIHIGQNCVCFGDLSPVRTLYALLNIRNLNLISIQS